MSVEGGSTVLGVPQIPEVVIEVTDLEGEYEGDWKRVKEEVQGINKKDEDWWLESARVHFVVNDRSVREIGANAFTWYCNLVKVTAPFVEEVGEDAFGGAWKLCHATFSPDDVVLKPEAFVFCLSLEVLAASVGFPLDT